jgi:hypothetical protein
MLVHVYVNSDQIGDFGYPPLTIGQDLHLTIVGNPGSPIGVEIPVFDCFLADKGNKTLIRTGLAEYAFCGEILEVRRQDRWNGRVYHEALIDCGVPIILVTREFQDFKVIDLDDGSSKELSRGRYVSGLTWLTGLISFRYPEPLIDKVLRAKVASISVIDLSPTAEVFPGLRAERSIDSYKARQPIILGIEVLESGQAR